MPSFRLLVDVHEVRAGVPPPQVADTLVGAVAAEGAFVESQDLDIVSGVPRLRVRFLVEDSALAEENAQALRIARSAHQRVGEIAVVGPPRLMRRTPRNRWLAVSAGTRWL